MKLDDVRIDNGRVRWGEQVAEVCATGAQRGYLLVDGHVVPYYWTRHGSVVHLWARGRTYRVELEDRSAAGPRPQGAGRVGMVEAPMPGTVFEVPVKVGDTVKRGQALVVMESMKMELTVAAPGDGVVAEILCTAGQLVEPHAPLVRLEASDAAQG